MSKSHKSQTTGIRPIGAIDASPLVVKTADLAAFLHRNLEIEPNGKPNYLQMVERIKACKANGQVVFGVSYEVLKRIYEEEAVATAESCADEILTASNGTDLLGKDIPLYRNPGMTDEKYVSIMKQRLQTTWEDEAGTLRYDWDEGVDMAFIESFEKID